MRARGRESSYITHVLMCHFKSFLKRHTNKAACSLCQPSAPSLSAGLVSSIVKGVSLKHRIDAVNVALKPRRHEKKLLQT